MSNQNVSERRLLSINTCSVLIINITIFSNLIGASTALFFTNHYVGLKSDSKIGQLAVIGCLKSNFYISQSL